MKPSLKLWIAGAMAGAALGAASAATLDLGRIFDIGKDVVTATTGVDEKDEIAVGREIAGRVLGAAPLVADPALQSYVNQVGRWIALQTERPDMPWRFGVLDSAAINAFAAPGGHVLITRGLYEILDNEAQLAGVLGHEIGHVTARHGVNQYTRAMATDLGARILSAAVPQLGNQIGQQLLGVIGNALLSGYGREDELQADRLGAEYIARNGYDPDAVTGVVGILKNQEEFEKKRAAAENREPRVYHGVFASHPSADDRLLAAVAEAQKFKTGATTRLAREDFLKRLDGTVFGDSPREGVRRGSSFYHRDLNFAVDFPDGWKIRNQPKSVVATAPSQAALLDLSAADIGKTNNPREFMTARLKTGDLARAGKVEGARLSSHTGVAHINTPFGRRDTRVSVLFHGPKAFVLLGTTREAGELDKYDARFLKTAASLRPLSESEKQLADGLRIRVKQAGAGDTFAQLAKKSPLSDYSESILRLVNAKFPAGEPKTGETIKVIE